jgi:hypothetical protein
VLWVKNQNQAQKLPASSSAYFLAALTSGDDTTITYLTNAGVQPNSFVAQIYSSLNGEGHSENMTLDLLSKLDSIDRLIGNLPSLISGPQILSCSENDNRAGKDTAFIVCLYDSTVHGERLDMSRSGKMNIPTLQHNNGLQNCL